MPVSRLSIPSGFTVFGNELPVIRPASKRIASDPIRRPIALGHASHRQRGVSRCPSGKSSSRNTPVRPIPGTHIMASTAAATAAR